MYTDPFDTNFMDPKLAARERPRDKGFLKQCNKCFRVLDGATRNELFTRYAWHLRLTHFPEWNRAHSTSFVGREGQVEG